MRYEVTIHTEWRDEETGELHATESARSTEMPQRQEHPSEKLGELLGYALESTTLPRRLLVVANMIETMRDGDGFPALTEAINAAEDALIDAAIQVIDAWGDFDTQRKAAAPSGGAA